MEGLLLALPCACWLQQSMHRLELPLDVITLESPEFPSAEGGLQDLLAIEHWCRISQDRDRNSPSMDYSRCFGGRSISQIYSTASSPEHGLARSSTGEIEFGFKPGVRGSGFSF